MPFLYARDPFLAVQHLLCSAWLDGPMEASSVACEGWAIALVGLAFVLSRERSLRVALRVALALGAALILAGIAVQVLKRVVDVPRPLAVFGPAAVHVLLQPLRRQAFPSGHSASAGALAAFALLRYRRAAWPLLLLAAAGGISRVYVGAHWVLDVIAGWAVGAAAAVIAARGWERLRAGETAIAPVTAGPPAAAE